MHEKLCTNFCHTMYVSFLRPFQTDLNMHRVAIILCMLHHMFTCMLENTHFCLALDMRTA